MGIGAAHHVFCRVCGTDHRAAGVCPGQLSATGAERPGWRVEVETPFGSEAIGVLLAPVHDQWRARIVTFPNVLWSAPGGRGTLKFVGDTAAEAEAQAIRFVEEHVRRKRATPVGRVAAPSPRPRPRPHFSSADARKRHVLPVRFGAQRAATRGATVNVSTDGMFVGAPAPEDDGQSLLIHVYLEGQMIPMRGLVMWNRFEAEPDRPVGMGIRLSNPPALYKGFIATLA
jgi:hypothetical protein